MNFEHRRLIINSFVICDFSYCTVTWMFHSRKLNARINRLHERALQVVYKDFNFSVGPKLWDKVPTEKKIPNFLRNLKHELRDGFTKTPCKICKLFMKHVGYLRPILVCSFVCLFVCFITTTTMLFSSFLLF